MPQKSLSEYKEHFASFVHMRATPNAQECTNFSTAQKAIASLEDISGILFVGVCNSLSMYATHPHSDIDLFIITRPHLLWYVRIRVTYRFWKKGIWRKGTAITNRFCLSFFATTRALDLQKIALQDDIYLYYWIYYLKPILVREESYARFLEANLWVNLPPEQLQENTRWMLSGQRKHPGILQNFFAPLFSSIFFLCCMPKTLFSYWRLGKPTGIILSKDMLKFHNNDRRAYFREMILGKNFDK